MLLTRSPLIHPASWASAFDLHVLSTPPAFVLSQDQTLRTKTKTLKPRKTNQPHTASQQSQQKHSKTKNRHKTKTNKHTIEFTNNTHTIKHIRISRMFSKGVPRHVSATRASRFVRCRSAQQGKQYALVRASSNQAQPMQRHLNFRTISTISRDIRSQTSPKSAILMLQTTRIWVKCAPALARFTSNPTQSRRSSAPELPTWPKPSRFLANSLPSIDQGAILGTMSADSPRPRTSINARNNDEWNPTPGL